MTVALFNSFLPDGSAFGADQNGAEALQSVRDNQGALRNAIMAGALAGWDVAVTWPEEGNPNYDPDQPQLITCSNTAPGTEMVLIALNWGDSGGADGNVVTITVSYLLGAVDHPVGIADITYNDDGFATALTWRP